MGHHFLLQGILLDQGLNLHLQQRQTDSFTTEPPGKPSGKWPVNKFPKLSSWSGESVRNKWAQLADCKWLIQTNFPDIFHWNWNILNHLRNIPQYVVYLGKKRSKSVGTFYWNFLVISDAKWLLPFEKFAKYIAYVT